MGVWSGKAQIWEDRQQVQQTGTTWKQTKEETGELGGVIKRQGKHKDSNLWGYRADFTLWSGFFVP